MKCSCCGRENVMIAILNGSPVCYYGCDHTSTEKIRIEEPYKVEEDFHGPPMIAYWSGGSE